MEIEFGRGGTHFDAILATRHGREYVVRVHGAQHHGAAVESHVTVNASYSAARRERLQTAHANAAQVLSTAIFRHLRTQNKGETTREECLSNEECAN